MYEEVRVSGESEWRPVILETWQSFTMALRAVIAELPPGAALLLRPEGDERVARIVARPARFEVHAHGQRLASFACGTETELLSRLEANVDEHWELDSPAQLSFSYEGDVSTRLREAFGESDLVSDLPQGERPSPTMHSRGEPGRDDVASRIDPAVLEKLRGMGSSAID